MLCCPVAPHKLSPVQSAFAKVEKYQNKLQLRSVQCGGLLADFIGGDLIKPDLGRWLEDVEKHKALTVYSAHKEGRYLIVDPGTRLRYQGYVFLDLSTRGLGDPETTLTKIHSVCPPQLGRQLMARWYFPPEVDYWLNLLPPEAKGLVD